MALTWKTAKRTQSRLAWMSLQACNNFTTLLTPQARARLHYRHAAYHYPYDPAWWTGTVMMAPRQRPCIIEPWNGNRHLSRSPGRPSSPQTKAGSPRSAPATVQDRHVAPLRVPALLCPSRSLTWSLTTTPISLKAWRNYWKCGSRGRMEWLRIVIWGKCQGRRACGRGWRSEFCVACVGEFPSDRGATCIEPRCCRVSPGPLSYRWFCGECCQLWTAVGKKRGRCISNRCCGERAVLEKFVFIPARSS